MTVKWKLLYQSRNISWTCYKWLPTWHIFSMNLKASWLDLHSWLPTYSSACDCQWMPGIKIKPPSLFFIQAGKKLAAYAAGWNPGFHSRQELVFWLEWLRLFWSNTSSIPVYSQLSACGHPAISDTHYRDTRALHPRPKLLHIYRGLTVILHSWVVERQSRGSAACIQTQYSDFGQNSNPTSLSLCPVPTRHEKAPGTFLAWSSS